MTTISTSTKFGIKLDPASYTSPVVIEAGVTISNPGYPNGIYTAPDSTTVFTIQNDGTIIGAASASGLGVYLAPGGSVTNAVSASIQGDIGVKVSGGAGTVVNDGSIAGNSQSYGVDLAAGGLVVNGASASITAGDGVYMSGGAGTVVNDGNIEGRTGALAGYGVILNAGGAITNEASGVITASSGGARLFGSTGALLNDGAISGEFGVRVSLVAGGLVSNAAAASLTGAAYGIYSLGAGALTVINDGSISATGDVLGGGFGTDGDAVHLSQGGGSVTNAPAGSIRGLIDGVVDETGVVVNDGTISGTGGGGVWLLGIGSVTNAAAGSIMGATYGVKVGAGDSITNATSAYITGGIGVTLQQGGTLTNAGTIIGTGGTAVAFGGTGSGTSGNLLMLDPGFVFSGIVMGSSSASNTLELASGASAGTVTGLGSQYLQFQSILFDAGADWSIAGGAQRVAGTLTALGSVQEQATTFVNRGSIIVNAGVLDVNGGTFDNEGTVTVENGGTFFIANAATLSGAGPVLMETGSTVEIATPVPAGQGFIYSDPATIILDDPSTFDGTIGGLAAGDIIKLAGHTITSGSITGTTLTLTLAGGGTQNLGVAPGESGVTFTTAASGGLAVACFAAGTRILTDAGEVPVQHLRVGDRVVTLRGRRIAPIVWLGHRYLDCVRHPRPDEVRPICIKAGAIADGVPHRDLWLSPEHAVLLRAGAETVLVPVRHLLNGTTIAQVPCASVTYWHVELASHDVVVAEGLAAETYLDTGNRADFANGGAAVSVHPSFAGAVWHAKACAPQLRYGEALAALQYRLAVRAAGRGGVREVRGQAGLS